MDQGNWIPMGGKGFGKVVGVGVEAIWMAADALAPSGKGVGVLAFG